MENQYIILDSSKHPAHSFKGGGKSWDEVKEFDNIAMIVPHPFIVLDFDTADDAEIMMRIVDALDIHCRIMKTDRGYHFWFRSSEQLKNFVKARLAIGIYCDRKVCNKNSYVVIKRNGKLREWLKDFPDDEVEFLPKWLTPLKTHSNSFDFKGMKSGDGRNQALFNYIVYMQDNKWTKDDILTTLEIINNYVFAQPLPPSEFNTICRDESFKDIDESDILEEFEYPFIRGKKPLPCKKNIVALLDHLGYEIKLNMITKNVEIFQNNQPCKISYASFVTDIKDHALFTNLVISRDNLFSILEAIAEDNKTNPLSDYFESCYAQHGKAIGKIDAFMDCFILEDGADEAFIHTLIKKWLIQGVMLAYNEGSTKPATILVFKGRQGLGKSRLVEKLLPKNLDLILTEQKIDMSIKDDIIRVTCYALVELAEIARSLRDIDRLKAFLTSDRDVYRAPYARTSQSYPRHTNFIGSVNDESFLVDNTGERRFSVVPLQKIDWNRLAEIDMDMVWAEVYHLAINEHESYWLTDEEIEKQNKSNVQYSVKSELEQRLYDMFDFTVPQSNWKESRSATEVAFVVYGDRTRSKASKVGRILNNLAVQGVIPKPKLQHGHGASKMYLLPPLLNL